MEIPKSFIASKTRFQKAPAPHVESSPTEARSPRLSREEEAKQVLEHTQISPSIAWCLCLLFLLTIFSVPAIQIITKVRGHAPVLPALDREGLVPRAAELKQFETNLESQSVVVGRVIPPTQNVLTQLGVGNENAYIGRDSWLVYRPDFNYVTGQGFLEPAQLQRRKHETGGDVPPQPDPIAAIVRFRDQLAKRHIRLVLLPTPLKTMLEAQHFAAGYDSLDAPLQNPSYQEFLRRMNEHHVMVCDPTKTLFQDSRRGAAQYLQTDTHWTPTAMQKTAGVVANFIRQTTPLPPGKTTYTARPVSIAGRGDIAQMLKLTTSQNYPPQTEDINQVLTPSGQAWRATPNADVLLLGDSFTNIYSLEGMGWGKAAGLAEQLSFQLRRPLDVIAINAGGSFATRRRLRAELLRDPDRLANKRIVVWQFAMRDLQSGDWPLVDLPTPLQSQADVDALAKSRLSSPATVARFRHALTYKAGLVEQQKRAHAPVMDGSQEWMFYLRDVDYLTNQGFLKAGSNPQVDALVDFKRQLKRRGIKLLVMPVPAKTTIYPEKMGLGDTLIPPVPQNPSFVRYRRELEAQGITVFDPTESLLLQKRRSKAPLYMPTDTHWTFAGMENTAAALAAEIKPQLPSVPPVAYTRRPVEVANITDISLMLERQGGNPQSMRVQQTVQQVQTPTGEVWKATPDADVLVLGDSFTNIYSHGGYWGQGAGLAGQLSFYLQRPIDLIAMDSGGINDTRLALQRDMKAGRDRLAGKKLVIFEVGARYLLRRDWEKIPLPYTAQTPLESIPASNPFPTSPFSVRATIKARSLVPNAATTPYPEMVMSLRLTNVQVVGQPPPANAPDILVYVWGMRNALPTPAATWKVGQSVTLRLTPWGKVEDEYGSYNRSELKGDDAAQLGTYWGVKQRESP